MRSGRPARDGGRDADEGKGPGQRLRTGVRPVGNGLGLRCLLGARALSRPNPPSSQTSRSPLRCHAWPRGRLDANALHHDVTPNLTSLPGPASEP